MTLGEWVQFLPGALRWIAANHRRTVVADAIDDDQLAEAAEVAEQLENAASDVVTFMGGGIEGIPFTLAFMHKLIEACVGEATPVATPDEVYRLEKCVLAFGSLTKAIYTIVKQIHDRQQ